MDAMLGFIIRVGAHLGFDAAGSLVLGFWTICLLVPAIVLGTIEAVVEHRRARRHDLVVRALNGRTMMVDLKATPSIGYRLLNNRDVVEGATARLAQRRAERWSRVAKTAPPLRRGRP